MPAKSNRYANSGGRPATLAALRHAIRGIEGRHLETDAAETLQPLGVAAIDEALGGGLPSAALHEIAAQSESEMAAATGFALALARRCVETRAVLWIAEEMGLRESGAPYGPGLDEIGLAPERIVTVVAAHARDVLWAMEEALRCRAVGAVIGEIRSRNVIDDVASRRLSLAAIEQRSCALLLRAMPDARPLAAATRWSVSAAASAPAPHGPGPPALHVSLVRNRCGPAGSWVLEWNRAKQRFDLASTHPQPVAAPAVDRPPAAARSA